MRKEDCANLFDKTAKGYDTINTLSTFGLDFFWRKTLAKNTLRYINRKESINALDIACGTGKSSFALASIEKNIVIDAIDCSKEMLSFAEKKAKHNSRIVFRKAFAEEISTLKRKYSLCLCAFGFRNMNYKEVLPYVRECLKHGGILGVLEFFTPSNLFEKTFHSIYVKIFMVLLARLINPKATSAYKYFASSVEENSKENFIKATEESGFVLVEERTLFMAKLLIFSVSSV